ncbi:hypothetical protein [Flavobacterium sp. XGLA_31]|uniref:hypothetical protein n=1 Tax=Flavobacterium sp. XGLA_31 TaxID=3447666 RepID=UPI003F3E3FEA
MKKFKTFGLIVAVILIAFHIYNIDFDDLGFLNNKTEYLGILAMSLVACSFLLGLIKDSHQK